MNAEELDLARMGRNDLLDEVRRLRRELAEAQAKLTHARADLGVARAQAR